MRNQKRPTMPPGNPLLSVGFATDLAAEPEILAAGASAVWVKGRGVETMDWALKYLRDRPGALMVAEDLRCLGDSRKEIFSQVKALASAGVSVIDVRDPEAGSLDLIERALKAQHSAAALGCRKTAQRRGRRGGMAKGAAARAERDAIVREDILRRIVNHPKLTWDDILNILCGAFSKSTLIRHCREAA